MNLNPIQSTQAARDITKPKPVSTTRTEASSAPATDRVELSAEAQRMNQARQVAKAESPERAAKLAEIKAQVESGEYFTQDKLNAAIDGAIDSALSGL